MYTMKITITAFIIYFFILLFCYAAISKMFDLENFQLQIAQSPMLSKYAGFVSYSVILIELFTVGLLCFEKTGYAGLIASAILMVIFSIYIAMLLNFGENLPCSCGRILQEMSWHQHLYFNIGCVILSVTALVLSLKYSRPDE